MILTRNSFSPEGVFGELLSDTDLSLLTLEHAYAYELDKDFIPKIPPGTYKCVRGEHQLHGMDHPFVTFEITGVKGHTNLLFHAGNFNKDSEGCVLLGMRQVGVEILHSRIAFEKFMKDTENINEFTLEVINAH